MKCLLILIKMAVFIMFNQFNFPNKTVKWPILLILTLIVKFIFWLSDSLTDDHHKHCCRHTGPGWPGSDYLSKHLIFSFPTYPHHQLPPTVRVQNIEITQSQGCCEVDFSVEYTRWKIQSSLESKGWEKL